MNKKVIAYVLIGLAAVVGVIYLLSSKSAALPGAAGTGGAFEADDNEAYKKMKALIPGGVPNWVNKIVADRYAANPGIISGLPSKAVTFRDVIGEVAPNDAGTFPATTWSGGKKLLWSNDAVLTPMWLIRDALISKYNTL